MMLTPCPLVRTSLLQCLHHSRTRRAASETKGENPIFTVNSTRCHLDHRTRWRDRWPGSGGNPQRHAFEQRAVPGAIERRASEARRIDGRIRSMADPEQLAIL